MKQETINYLLSLHGWCEEEKMLKLYELVKQCSEEIKDTVPLSVELGIFGGRSLLPMAYAHKELRKGFALGIDSWDNVTPTEGSNAPANNEWWSKLDIGSVFASFNRATLKSEWSGNVKYLKGRSDAFAKDFADESITILHQDSNHNSEVITKELELWSPKVKTGGYWIADDTNWVEAKEGYGKLPAYGFELVEDFGTWQMWKKVGVKKVEPVAVVGKGKKGRQKKGVVKAVNADAEEVFNISKIDSKIGAIKGDGGIQFGNLYVKPIMIYIPDTPEWKERGEKGLKHFAEHGIENIFVMNGFHGEKWGIAGRHIYLADGKPEEQYYIGHGKVAGNLTQYMSFVVMDALPYTHFLSLEDDCRFKEGWKEKLDAELLNVPPDFDILFVGSCCCGGKMGIHVKGDVYEFPYRGGSKWNWYPQCSHALLIAKKAVPHLIATNRDVANPSDVSLVLNSFKDLKVFAILPRLAEQENTNLPE